MRNFDEWINTVPDAITADPLWQRKVYRLALFLGALADFDTTRLVAEQRTVTLADQLFRAVGADGAHIAAGHSRSVGQERARFYEYTLGATREARHWYYLGVGVLSSKVVNHRVRLLAEISRQLLRDLPGEQKSNLAAEEKGRYEVEEALPDTLKDAPLPYYYNVLRIS